MSLIKTDYSNLQDNDYAPVPEGDYECVMDKARFDSTPHGVENFAIKLRIRDDLDQAMPETNGKYHKRNIFVSMFRSKQTGKYNLNNFMYLLRAAKVPEGVELKKLEDITELLEGKPVRVHVTVETDNYGGNDTKRNRVAPWGFHETKFPPQKPAADPFADKKQANVSDDNDQDLPF